MQTFRWLHMMNKNTIFRLKYLHPYSTSLKIIQFVYNMFLSFVQSFSCFFLRFCIKWEEQKIFSVLRWGREKSCFLASICLQNYLPSTRIMRTFSKSPRVVKKMASPPRVPPESKTVTGNTEKLISIRSSTSNLPITTKISGVQKKSEVRTLNPAPSPAINSAQSIPARQEDSPALFQQTSSRSINPRSQISPSIYKIEEHGLEYEGSIIDGQFEGYGTLYDPKEPKNRYIYKGQWRGGARNGKGHYIYPDYSEYEGEWLDNYKHGRGTFASGEGEYSGQWSYGKRHGTGTMTLQNSRVKLEGYWQDDEFVAGKVTYDDGSSYNGPIRNFEREGQGEYYYLDNSEYSGNWKENQKSGKGKYRFANGDLYDGEFLEGKRAGRSGRYIWKDNGHEIVDSVYENDRLLQGKIYQGATQSVVKTINTRPI